MLFAVVRLWFVASYSAINQNKLNKMENPWQIIERINAEENLGYTQDDIDEMTFDEVCEIVLN